MAELDDTYKWTHTTSNGYAPLFWFGTTAVDGTTAPFKSAPIGSIYEYKPDETTEPTLYKKAAMNNVTADWATLVSLTTNDAQRIVIKKIAVTTLTNAEIDTGWDLPAKAVVLDAWVNVTTLEATGTTKTIDVGLLSGESGGDTDGFLDGISTATPASLKKGAVTVSGGVYSANTFGVLLSDYVVGTNTDDRGLFNRKFFLSDSVTAKSVVYQLGSAHTELVADIYIMYALLAV